MFNAQYCKKLIITVRFSRARQRVPHVVTDLSDISDENEKNKCPYIAGGCYLGGSLKAGNITVLLFLDGLLRSCILTRHACTHVKEHILNMIVTL